MPPERVHLAHRCIGIEQDGKTVRARFENGAEIEADVLIAADGIFSAVRRALLGPERPRFACRAYRGLIPVEKVRDIPPEVDGVARSGPAFHPLLRLGRPDAELRRPRRAGGLDQRILDRARQASSDLRAAYAGWHPQVQRVIDAVDETFIWAVLDRPPISRWTYGRITMLGDACHPMIPFMGQGGAQAIEDAAAITACLVQCGDDVEAALKLYEAVRLPRTTQVQNVSWENMTRFHMPDGPAQVERDAADGQGHDRLVLQARSPGSTATTRRCWTGGPESRPNPRSLTAKHLLTISSPLAAGVLAAVGFLRPLLDRFRSAFMANTSSARKAARKIARRTEVNKARRSRMRSALRAVEEAIASGDRNKALEAMKNAEPALMRAARQGQVHQNTASRKVSRLTHQIAKLGK